MPADRETTALLQAIDDWCSTHRHDANYDEIDRRLNMVVGELHPGSVDADHVSPGQRAARAALASHDERPNNDNGDGGRDQRRSPADSFRDATSKARERAAREGGATNDDASGDHSPAGRREAAASGKGT